MPRQEKRKESTEEFYAWVSSLFAAADFVSAFCADHLSGEMFLIQTIFLGRDAWEPRRELQAIKNG